MVQPALGAAEALDATVANMRFVKPLDVELVKTLAREHDYLVTVEEGCVMGGAGSAVLEALSEAGIDVPVLQLGLPDRFIDHGDPPSCCRRADWMPRASRRRCASVSASAGARRRGDARPDAARSGWGGRRHAPAG